MDPRRLKRITVTNSAEEAANLDPKNPTIPWEKSRTLSRSTVFEDLTKDDAQWLIQNLVCPASIGMFDGTNDSWERGMAQAAKACVKNAKKEYEQAFNCEWEYPSIEEGP